MTDLSHGPFSTSWSEAYSNTRVWRLSRRWSGCAASEWTVSRSWQRSRSTRVCWVRVSAMWEKRRHLAWAEVNHAVAIIDERAGTRRGRQRGVEVHGTLWLVAEGFRLNLLSDEQAELLVTALSDTSAWFPCSGSEFLGWARREGLF